MVFPFEKIESKELTKEELIEDLKNEIKDLQHESEINAMNNVELVDYIMGYIDFRFSKIPCVKEVVDEMEEIKVKDMIRNSSVDDEDDENSSLTEEEVSKLYDEFMEEKKIIN